MVWVGIAGGSAYLFLSWILELHPIPSAVGAALVSLIPFAEQYRRHRAEKRAREVLEDPVESRRRLLAGLRDIDRAEAVLQRKRDKTKEELARLEPRRTYRVADPPEDTKEDSGTFKRRAGAGKAN